MKKKNEQTEREYTIKQIMELWMQNHPTTQISRTTIYNWAKKFGWILNPDRILVRQRMIINADKFDEFNANPSAFLEK